MGELGSIFEEARSEDGAPGPDLRVEVTVLRSHLERDEGVCVPVPDEVAYGEGTVPRRRGADDPPGAVRLHLSPQLGERAMLRLRGQGGEHPESGRAGDLLVVVTVVEGGSGRGWVVWLVVVAVVVAGGLGVAAWLR